MPARALPRISLSPAARAQLGLFLFAYFLYSAARFVTIGDLSVAQANADWIMDLEDTLSFGIESSVQQALTGTVFIWLLNHLYLIAQLGVIPGALIFLWHRSKPMYERLRNTILATWVLSIPIYAAFPVAPPRLADSGLVDTITTQTGLSLDSSFTTSFYNELAAVPSLHVGFAVIVGMAVAAAVRNPVLKFAWLLWGPVIGLAVLATGNHYVFDIAAGVVAAGLGYLLGAAVARMAPQSPVPQPALAGA